MLSTHLHGRRSLRVTKGVLLTLSLFFIIPGAAAQEATYPQPDTLSFATYNLLNYGNSANRSSVKKPKLSVILTHMAPDLIGFNEV